jgi:hypothetical protein
VSPLWLAQLFAILCLSSQLSKASASETLDQMDPKLNDREFLRSSAKSLVLGNYAKPQRHAVEALLLYTQCMYMSRLDPLEENWALFGVVVRLAMRMGYHRDARNLSGINAFDGEMRRRTWAVIWQLDTLLSFQIGLPSLIQSDFCDAEIPRNLLDNDFNEFTTQLPVSRADTEFTETLYFIVKSRMLNVMREVIRISLSLKTVPYDEVRALDAQLRHVHESIPLLMRRRPISQCFTDPTQLILGRINCELLFQKSLCVLHRKYLGDDPGHFWSRETCTDAALTILEIQRELREESLPGRQLFRDRWMLSSITLHDFLLAATIICLDLSERHETLLHPSSSTKSTFENKLSALRRSYAIFVEQSADSKHAGRCADAIGYMLPRIQSRPSECENTLSLLKTVVPHGELEQTGNVAAQSRGDVADDKSQLREPEIVDWVS